MEFNMTFRTRRSSFSNRRRANSGIPGYDNQGWDAFGHPASYAQPEVDEYGIDSDFGEGVRKGPYLSGPPPASVGWMPDHPAVDEDLVEDYETGSQLHELNLKQAMERKASKCIQLAEKKLGRKASARAIENLALSYMNLSNSTLQRKLSSSFLADEADMMSDEFDMMADESDMFAENVVQEGTGYFGEVDAEDLMSDEFESDEADMMAEMSMMARRANRGRFAGKKSEDSSEAEQLAEEAVETAEQLAEEVEELKAELQAMKKANLKLRQAGKKSEDASEAESIAEEAVSTAEQLAEEVENLAEELKQAKKANLRLRQAKKSDGAEQLAEEAVETAEQLAEEVETLSSEVESLAEELKQAKKANARLRQAKKSEEAEELSDSEVLEEEIKALKKANARLRQRLAGSEVLDALEQNYSSHGEQPVERFASSRKAGVGRLANVLSSYMADDEGIADDGTESLADLLAEIEAEEAMEQQASKFASKKANKKAGQNDPRHFYQEEIEAREGKQSAKKAMFMAEDETEYMMADEVESEEEQADWMADEVESDEVDPFGLNAEDMMSEDADPRLASLFSFASDEDEEEVEETETASKKASRFAKAKKSEEETEEEESEEEEVEEEEEEEEEKPAKKAPAKKAPAKEEGKAPAKEEGKASSKKASITPRPKTQQASVKTLGNISRTASDANELSKLWESAPDVSKFFS